MLYVLKTEKKCRQRETLKSLQTYIIFNNIKMGLLYKSILKPIWTYGIQLWGTASTSNIEILERFQSKALRIIVDAPWYVPNNHIRRDLQMTSVKEEICRSSNQYYTRLTIHPNDQILTLMEIPGNRRLRRHVPNDLPDRFLL
jgi:hypothetical protein